MGYPTELFVESKIKEEFLCSICHDVLQDPVLVQPCEHAFCKQCITTWSKGSASATATCPSDRKRIEGLKPPPRVYMNLLNGLQTRCSFREEGCTEILTLGELELHKEKCKFNPDAEVICHCGRSSRRSSLVGHNCVSYLIDYIKMLQLDWDQAGEFREEEFDEATKELEATKKELKTTKEELVKCQQQLKDLQQKQEQQQLVLAYPSASLGQFGEIGKFIPCSDITCAFKTTNIRPTTYQEILDTIYGQVKLIGIPSSSSRSRHSLDGFKLILQSAIDEKFPAPAFAETVNSPRGWRADVGPVYSYVWPGTLPPDARMVILRVRDLVISLRQGPA